MEFYLLNILKGNVHLDMDVTFHLGINHQKHNVTSLFQLKHFKKTNIKIFKSHSQYIHYKWWSNLRGLNVSSIYVSTRLGCEL